MIAARVTRLAHSFANYLGCALNRSRDMQSEINVWAWKHEQA
jgi:hypothetical protein